MYILAQIFLGLFLSNVCINRRKFVKFVKYQVTSEKVQFLSWCVFTGAPCITGICFLCCWNDDASVNYVIFLKKYNQ